MLEMLDSGKVLKLCISCGPPSVTTVFGTPYSEKICFKCSIVVEVFRLLSFCMIGNLL